MFSSGRLMAMVLVPHLGLRTICICEATGIIMHMCEFLFWPHVILGLQWMTKREGELFKHMRFIYSQLPNYMVVIYIDRTEYAFLKKINSIIHSLSTFNVFMGFLSLFNLLKATCVVGPVSISGFEKGAFAWFNSIASVFFSLFSTGSASVAQWPLNSYIPLYLSPDGIEWFTCTIIISSPIFTR